MENLKLPVALVAAMGVQLAGGVWWVSQQASTIASLEETVSQLGSRMAIEDNVNLKRDVQDNMDYIEGAFDEIEELWEEAAALSKTISRITELQQRIALAEKTLEYYGRELMNRKGAM
jgi:hypothetical protein|tara:strand:- start:74 stop:427 length:354 start_codon:yes stop_codon:yes gene_type:complete